MALFYDMIMIIMNKNEIVNKFLDFKTINVIESAQYTPDVRLTLLLIDDKKFVLDETDYFDKVHESNGIKELFNLRVVKWVCPKEYDSTKYDDIALRVGSVVYGLAMVK